MDPMNCLSPFAPSTTNTTAQEDWSSWNEPSVYAWIFTMFVTTSLVNSIAILAIGVQLKCVPRRKLCRHVVVVVVVLCVVGHEKVQTEANWLHKRLVDALVQDLHLSVWGFMDVVILLGGVSERHLFVTVPLSLNCFVHGLYWPWLILDEALNVVVVFLYVVVT